MDNIERQNNPNEGAFLKSLLKINNPTWTPEQIEAEYEKRKLLSEQNPDDHTCEACSG